MPKYILLECGINKRGNDMNIKFENEVNNQVINNNCKPQGIEIKNVEAGMIEPASGYVKGDNSLVMAYQEKNSVTNGINAMDGSKSQKDYMILMSNTVSDKDYKELQEHGFKPGKMTPEETVTVVDEIKAVMAKSGNVVSGYNDDLDIDKLKSITGSEVYARELDAAFKKYDVPVTDTNVNEAVAALNMAMELKELSDGTLQYMTENNMKPTIENLYIASHNGRMSSDNVSGYFMDSNGYLGKKSEVVRDSALDNQIRAVVEESGYELNDEVINDAYGMIDKGIALTDESFARYEDLKNLKLPLSVSEAADKIAMAEKDGIRAKDADLSEDSMIMDRAKEYVDALKNISEEAVDKVCRQGKKVNLKNLSMVQKSISASISITNVSFSQSSASYRASLTEIRISMTVSSTAFLMRNGIDVYNEDLNMLSQELKEAGNRQFEALFGEEFEVDKAELKNLFEEVTEKTAEIKGMPLGTIGMLSVRSSFNLNTVYEEGKSLQSQYIKANEKYEPLMTEVRADLGDSIKKAFSNVSDILKEMGMEVSEENERAVRILGYSSQEINSDSVELVKNVYEKVHNVISKMTPAKTLELIREGVNPLEISMEELNRKLDMNPLDPVSEAERYSHFLYRMEKSGKITEDEKESFIGIYRMINNIEKQDSAAIGTLIASNGEINFKNLVSAVRTRHNKGIDARINDEFGSIEKLSFKDKTITQQIEKAFEGRDYSEPFMDSDNIELNYIRDNESLVRESGEIRQDIINLLVENGIKPTTDNILSAKEINQNRGTTYKNIAKLSEKSTLNSKNVDNNVENTSEETDNVENRPDFTEESLGRLLDSFEDKEICQSGFSEMIDRCESFLNAESLKAGSYIDVKNILSSMKSMSVIRKMAMNECYEVPAYIDGELSSVRVKILHDVSKTANVNITLDTEGYGKVGASFGVVNGQLEGMILCDSEAGLNRIRTMEEAFTDKISKDISVKRISYFKSLNTEVNYYQDKSDNIKESENDASKGLEADGSKDAISTKTLYTVAREFIGIIK